MMQAKIQPKRRRCKNHNIRVVTVAPNESPKAAFVANTNAAFKKIVGDCIEAVCFYNDPNLCIICNESAKLEGLPENLKVGDQLIAGTFLVTKFSSNGNIISLTETEATDISEHLGELRR